MKTASIIPADRMVYVDGEGYACDFTASEGVHAIQWFGDHGQIERNGRAAAAFMDVATLDPYLDAWRKARATAKRAAADGLKARCAETAGIIASHRESLGHVDQQIEEHDGHLADKSLGEATRPAIENSLALVKNHRKRLLGEIATLEASAKSLDAAHSVADELATQAEASAA